MGLFLCFSFNEALLSFLWGKDMLQQINIIYRAN